MPTEDDIYRASTQYRLWNFTAEKLASLRADTNAVAQKTVKAAIKRKRAAQLLSGSSTPASDAGAYGSSNGEKKEDKPIDCLTAEEEKKLVDYYCATMLRIAESILKLPINVGVCILLYQELKAGGTVDKNIREQQCSS